MLKEWQSENEGITYSYFDTYSAMSSLIQSPASYGITMLSFHENYGFLLSARVCARVVL
jgi:phospholipase/lecithinase/hemolysin